MVRQYADELVVQDHKMLVDFRDTMSRIIWSIYPKMNYNDIVRGVEYSIQKRFKNFDLTIHNNYTNKTAEMTMLEMIDYIAQREPIITSYGVLFKKHDQVPNPLATVIDSFLTLRKVHKKEMFKYPKKSEMFERYNLLQSLDKIDVNVI